MGKSWWRWLVGVLALCGLVAGAWWRAPGAREEPAAEPVAAIDAAVGEGCALLAGLQPVELWVRLKGAAPGPAGTGFLAPETGRIWVPVRRLMTVLSPGPLGVHWEESGRTVSLLREGQVLSIHFPEGRDRSALAVLNGDVVGADAVLCQGRLYAPLRLLADGLGLRYQPREGRGFVVEPR